MFTAENLMEDQRFWRYLHIAQISFAERGGTFVGNHGLAPAEFHKYGIVLPRGGMIIPDMERGEVVRCLFEAHNLAVAAEKAEAAAIRGTVRLDDLKPDALHSWVETRRPDWSVDNRVMELCSAWFSYLGFSRSEMNALPWVREFLNWGISPRRPSVYRKSPSGFVRNLWCDNHCQDGRWSGPDALAVLATWGRGTEYELPFPPSETGARPAKKYRVLR